MKIKTNTPLKAMDGEPIKIGNTEEVLTLGKAIFNLLTMTKGAADPHLSYVLSLKMLAKEVDLSAEDIVFIKNECKGSQVYHTLVTGQVMHILSEAK